MFPLLIVFRNIFSLLNILYKRLLLLKFQKLINKQRDSNRIFFIYLHGFSRLAILLRLISPMIRDENSDNDL